MGLPEIGTFELRNIEFFVGREVLRRGPLLLNHVQNNILKRKFTNPPAEVPEPLF